MRTSFAHTYSSIEAGAMKLKQAYRAAYSIRRCKTKQGKRKAILRWCAAMKEALK